jgi:ferric-dicitrate binding protein FerR (iron transport regulator)
MATSDHELFEQIHELVSKCLEGSETEGERNALNELISGSEKAREIYLQYMSETALLRWHSATPSSELLRDLGGAESEPARPAAWRRLLMAGIGGAALAVGLLVAGTILRQAEGPNQAGTAQSGAATLTRLANVRWTSGSHGWRELSRVGPGDVLRFDRGEAELVFDHGVEIVIRGPAHFEVRAPDRAYSSLGRIAARVGKDGEGFTIETPIAKVVDLGTEFAIEVASSGLTDVAVFDGLVDLSINAGDRHNSPRRLTQGEALRIDPDGRLNRLMTIPSDRFPVPRSRPPSDSQKPLIVDVWDNSPAGQATKFYQIVRNGLTEDAMAYVDRYHEWNGVDKSGIPAFLRGTDYVMPFNDDKSTVGFELSIELARPATLYVFLSKAVPVPDWLVQDFVDTGYEIGLDEGRNRFWPKRQSGRGPGKSIDTPFSIWSRRVNQPGTVKLGAIQRPADVNGFNMYGIAAAPLMEPDGPQAP